MRFSALQCVIIDVKSFITGDHFSVAPLLDARHPTQLFIHQSNKGNLWEQILLIRLRRANRRLKTQLIPGQTTPQFMISKVWLSNLNPTETLTDHRDLQMEAQATDKENPCDPKTTKSSARSWKPKKQYCVIRHELILDNINNVIIMFRYISVSKLPFSAYLSDLQQQCMSSHLTALLINVYFLLHHWSPPTRSEIFQMISKLLHILHYTVF